MAANNARFVATIQRWAEATEADLLAIFRESVEDFVDEMQVPVGGGGNMPVDTGFLRMSVRLSLTGPEPMTRANPGKPVPYDNAQISLAIRGLELGKPAWISYVANYAAYVHFGVGGREGRQWITLAAQNWPAIVARATARVKEKRGGQ